MKAGKLDNQLLKSIVFNNITYQREEIIVRAGIGEDCAVIDFGEFACVMSTDPITGANSQIGRLAIHIACNDIAASGVEPLGLLLTVLVPEGTSEEELNQVMQEAGEAAAELNVEIMGGHTEVTPAVNKILISTTVIGKQTKDKIVFTKGANLGDLIIMTKTAGLEGSSIIAHDREEELNKALGIEIVAAGKKMLQQVSVVQEGVLAGEAGATAMHDITEGGLLGALWELCEASGKGAIIEKEKIKISPITQSICSYFQIDPLRLISSGSMLITVPAEKAEKLLTILETNKIVATIIGVITKEGKYLKEGDNLLQIAPPQSDELYRI